MKRSFFVEEPHVTMGPLLAQARYAVFMKVGVIFRPKESSQKRQFYNDTKLLMLIISMKLTDSLTQIVVFSCLFIRFGLKLYVLIFNTR